MRQVSCGQVRVRGFEDQWRYVHGRAHPHGCEVATILKRIVILANSTARLTSTNKHKCNRVCTYRV